MNAPLDDTEMYLSSGHGLAKRDDLAASSTHKNRHCRGTYGRYSGVPHNGPGEFL